VVCIFCKEEKERGKEHIWPRWLQIVVEGNTKGMHIGTHFSMLNPNSYNIRIQSGESLVFGEVCKDCNNGWMNIIEMNFKPVLLKLFSDKNHLLDLNRIDRQSIALWAFKTALMINAGSNYRKIIPQSHYTHLYKNRALIKDVKVDIAQINEKKKLSWRQSPIEFGLAKSYEKEKFHNLLSVSYKITMQIKSIGIRVSFFPSAKESGYEIDFSEKNKNIRIWPHTKNISFNLKLNYDNIDDFDLDCGIKPAHNTWQA